MKYIYIIFSLFLSFFLVTSCIKDFQIVTDYPYEIGDYYSEDGVMGIVFQVSDDGAHGKILSLNEFQCAWGDTLLMHTNDTLNGYNNMKIIKQTNQWEEKFPAFFWCESKNVEDIKGWYLPAKNELQMILTNREKINQTLESIGAESLLGKIYWSSTEYNQFEVYHADFITGEMNFYAIKLSTNSLYVRAVKEF